MKFGLEVLLAGIRAVAAPHSTADIVDTALAQKYTNFVAGLRAAGLIDTLKGPGPFKVFVPTNEAFAILPSDEQAFLCSPWRKVQLLDIFKYYVVPGKLSGQDLAKLASVKTLEGQSIPLVIVDGETMVGKAHLTVTDIETSNGVIHLIDTVIFPRPVLEDREHSR
jgi:uncharacterized surface protein with fasciclin (FAS1) repeats